MSRFEKWFVFLTSALIALTGAGYYWTKYLVESSDPWAAVNHPLEPWFLRTHILVAPLLVFALGLITTRHIWRHLRNGLRGGRRSGIVTALVVVPMVVTGYLLQVITHEGWLMLLGYGHLGFGAIYAVGAVLHEIFVPKNGKRPNGNGNEHGNGKGQAQTMPAQLPAAEDARPSTGFTAPGATIDSSPGRVRRPSRDGTASKPCAPDALPLPLPRASARSRRR